MGLISRVSSRTYRDQSLLPALTMFIIGLSGGIACGKSCVSKYLRENHGVAIIDCDIISKTIYPPHSPTYNKILADPAFTNHTETFVNAKSKEIERRKLGELIFKDDEMRAALNKIVHPAIRKEILKQIFRQFLKREKFVVVDAPTLFESKSMLDIC